MSLQLHTALVACSHPQRKELYADTMLKRGWDVHTVSRGTDALEMLHKRRYQLIMMDDSVPDQSPLEFCLNATDIASNAPTLMVASGNFTPVQAIWEKCRIAAAAPARQIVKKLPAVMDAIADGGG